MPRPHQRTSVKSCKNCTLEEENLKKLHSCEIKELFCMEGDTGNKEMYAAPTLSTIKKNKLGRS
ncbi:putative disease resistance protein [Gossypium australe]|uniref:Putative disease resistance protein n=1 Tax=Gossypium australe TaxID=47621 RepID=A0A5B6VUW5_9ROSI|nr:putative disease resistance protein [Gossypium australe]